MCCLPPKMLYILTLLNPEAMYAFSPQQALKHDGCTIWSAWGLHIDTALMGVYFVLLTWVSSKQSSLSWPFTVSSIQTGQPGCSIRSVDGTGIPLSRVQQLNGAKASEEAFFFFKWENHLWTWALTVKLKIKQSACSFSAALKGFNLLSVTVEKEGEKVWPWNWADATDNLVKQLVFHSCVRLEGSLLRPQRAKRAWREDKDGPHTPCSLCYCVQLKG